MTVLEAVRKWLAEHGYQGLARDDCGCPLDDLAPCGALPSDCLAARQGTDEWGEEGWYAPEGAPDVEDILVEVAQKLGADGLRNERLDCLCNFAGNSCGWTPYEADCELMRCVPVAADEKSATADKK